MNFKKNIFMALLLSAGFSSAVMAETTEQTLVKVSKLLEEIKSSSATNHILPAGAVVAFALIECPDGWGNYKEAEGMFLRGIDPSGKIDAKRDYGVYQSDAIQNHRHSIMSVVTSAHGPANKRGHGFSSGNYKTLTDTTKSVDIDFKNIRIANETRPKNIAVLYCKKN